MNRTIADAHDISCQVAGHIAQDNLSKVHQQLVYVSGQLTRVDFRARDKEAIYIKDLLEVVGLSTWTVFDHGGEWSYVI